MAKKLSAEESQQLLKSLHRVFKNKGVVAPVTLDMGTVGGKAVTMVWKCRKVNGHQRCGWVPA